MKMSAEEAMVEIRSHYPLLPEAVVNEAVRLYETSPLTLSQVLQRVLRDYAAPRPYPG